MRDRLEEPFEFRVHTTGATVSRRRADSWRVGALVLALGLATFCAVLWPSQPKKTQRDANVQNVASTAESSTESLASTDDSALYEGFEDAILNDRREEYEEQSALELADTALFEEDFVEETESIADEQAEAKNPVASASCEERQGDAQIASSSFETQAEPQAEVAIEDAETTPEEPKREVRGVKAPTAKTAKTTNAPGYFARAANLPGKHNAFSLRNFARATNLIDPNDAYSPRSLTNATQVDALDGETR